MYCQKKNKNKNLVTEQAQVKAMWWERRQLYFSQQESKCDHLLRVWQQQGCGWGAVIDTIHTHFPRKSGGQQA